MADNVASNYIENLSQALMVRKDWLEKSEIPKLKEELRIFQISFSVLYNMWIKKKLINEDPYKQETKITDLEIPDSSALNEAKRLEQISLRLASYDSQLDFLVNFYQFGVDFLNLDRIRRIHALVKYIDWANLTPDSASPNTKAVAEIALHSKSGVDQITLSVIGESLTKLPKCTASAMKTLRDINNYHKETYKLTARTMLPGLQAGEANTPAIKKKLQSARPGMPFYPEFIDEMVKEDFSKDSQSLRDAVIASLAIAEEKPKAAKPKVNYKNILLDGIQAIGAASAVLAESGQKMDDNASILENQKKGFWYKLRMLFRTIVNAEPEEVVYELQYIDQSTGAPKRESLHYNQFRTDLDKKTRILSGMNNQGPVMAKLKAMSEEQITGYLDRTIRDVQVYFRTLTALDEYFKSNAPKDDRVKIKGIKPELASIKNCIVKANQLRHDYTAQKEEEEQMKRMGLHTDS